MGSTLKEKLEALPAERRERIEQAAERLIEDYQTLKGLRLAKQQTQAEMAKKLHIRQASVAKLEQRSDIMLSTLRNYVEAMGGKLQLVVEFPDARPVFLNTLGETEEPKPSGKTGV